MSSAAARYKQRKEDFVSNLSGGPVSEISFVTLVAPVAVLLWSVLQARHSFFKPYTILGFSIDFFLNVGAILLATTLYSSEPILLNLLLVAPSLLLLILPRSASARRKTPRAPTSALSSSFSSSSSSSSTAEGEKDAAGAPAALSVKPFLTTYRGCMMIVTCVAILAVDFRLFPRRFAKVETWGTSLMDMGVGAFVFSAGVVAARAPLKERMAGRSVGLATRLGQSLRHSIPLLVLGVIRLLSVKGLDYAEHVTEYGVHWNFFFTLGFLPPFVALFQAALALVPSHAALALLVAGGYQVLLERTSLKAFLLTAPRTDFLSKNREGIFSFFGYLAIFLAGQDLGNLILPRRIPAGSSAQPGVQRNTLLMTIASWAGIWTALYVAATSFTLGLGLTVSRRMANLPYVLWVAAFNCWQMLAFCAVDSFFFPSFYNATTAKAEKGAYEAATSPVLRAFNRNGLVVFLLANLLTGLVNMTVSTLDATPVATMGILLGYAATVTGAAVLLDSLDISIKL